MSSKKPPLKEPSEAEKRILRKCQELESRLREREKRYRDLLEHLPVGVYRTTPEGRIIEANRTLANLLGYDDPADLKDINVGEFYVNKSDREAHIKKLESSLTYFSEFELMRRDGSIIYVRDFPRAVLNASDKVQHYTGILVDISSQRETEIRLQSALAELENSNRERQAMISRLENLSLLDDLTKLFNRRGFFAEAQRRLQESYQQQDKIFFVFIDLDNLKWINDSWGHQRGDQALVEVAGILKSTLRRTDIKGRLGGDEFAVLAQEAPGFTPEALVGRIQEKITAVNEEQAYPFRLSISLGVSYYDPEYPSTLDELMIRADKLMYEQKRAKRN